MDWKTPAAINGGMKMPERWLLLHYYEALNILFRTENSLRVFVYIVLKSSLFDKWTDAEVSTSETQKTTIGAIANQRVSQAQGFGYLGYQITSPLLHLNSGELIRLMTDTYWELFKPYFKGKKELMRIKLDEINVVRNSLAHFRPIKHDDVELIKQNIRHTLLGIEECLSQALRVFNVVPTNTMDQWYIDFRALSAEGWSFEVYQSGDEKWRRMYLQFNAWPVTRQSYGGTFEGYRMLKVKTPAILSQHNALRNRMVYATESASMAFPPDSASPSCSKSISFVFSAQSLSSFWDEIASDLQRALTTISTEVDLLRQDNLARGSLVEAVTGYGSRKDEQSDWNLPREMLKCDVQSDSPSEYWGDFFVFNDDFIAGTHQYPWMPSQISQIDM